jgi:hypothetical protein
MLVIFFYWKHGINWRTWFFHKNTNVVTTTNIDMVISIIIVTNVDIDMVLDMVMGIYGYHILYVTCE